MEQERINEGFKEFNREEKENFVRYDFFFYYYLLFKKLWRFLYREGTMCYSLYIIDVILYQYYICFKSLSQFIKFRIKVSINYFGKIKFCCYCVFFDYIYQVLNQMYILKNKINQK